jgi:hypothetical protein
VFAIINKKNSIMFNVLALSAVLSICQSEAIYPELTYRTKSERSSATNFESYCHYFSVITFGRVHTYVPYCFRTVNISTTDSIQGESFRSLYEQNRTISDLFFPHASLDIIEDYQIYVFHRQLNKSNPIPEEQLYQRCEPPSFGDVCQYRFSTNDEFIPLRPDVAKWQHFANIVLGFILKR